MSSSLVYGDGTIYIRADGNVEGTAAIRREGNVYTFTGNIYGSIVVEKDNVMIDGAGHTLQGTGNETGIQITSGENMTIKNLNIKLFGIGIALEDSSKCTIVGNNMVYNNWGIKLYNASGNTISENQITENIPIEGLFDGGIFICGSSNRVYGNYIADNENGVILYNDYGGTSNNTISENYITNNDVGIRFYDGYGGTSNNSIFENYITNNGVGIYIDKIPWGGGVSNNSICRNSFMGNARQVYDFYWDDKLFIRKSVNSWDDGAAGNYWSDYDGEDADGDGIGDTPYIIDENNRDNYPLMAPLVTPQPTDFPSPAPSIAPTPLFSPEPTNSDGAEPTSSDGQSRLPWPEFEFAFELFVVASIVTGTLAAVAVIALVYKRHKLKK